MLKCNLFLWCTAEFIIIITPVFRVTWSSEIILINWFTAQETFLIIINVEKSCAASYFCGNCAKCYFSEFSDEYKVQKNIFYFQIKLLLTHYKCFVTFDQLNASLLISLYLIAVYHLILYQLHHLISDLTCKHVIPLYKIIYNVIHDITQILTWWRHGQLQEEQTNQEKEKEGEHLVN